LIFSEKSPKSSLKLPILSFFRRFSYIPEIAQKVAKNLAILFLNFVAQASQKSPKRRQIAQSGHPAKV